MKKAFVGNIGTQKLHILKYTDGRCKLPDMKKVNWIEFDDFKTAMQYEEPDGHTFVKCGVCFKKAEKDGWKDEA